MKVIDLLNKIANNEEVPKKIRIGTTNYTFDNADKHYKYCSDKDVDGCCDIYSNTLILSYERCRNLNEFLNDEVKILEDETENKIQELPSISHIGAIENVEGNILHIIDCLSENREL